MKYISSYIVTAFFIFLKQVRRAIGGVQAYVHALQQPRMQYHIALLLVTALAFLVGWPLFLSTLPHVSFVLLGHRAHIG